MSTTTNPRPPTENQLSASLPGPIVYLTGHDPTSGDAIVQSRRPAKWTRHDGDQLNMSVAYTTSRFPADLNGDADVAEHDARVAGLGLVSRGGTVLRIVNFAPGYECMMHRTQSVDYGIVVEGEITSVLGDGEGRATGEEEVLRRGDIMVQRATMHAWRNDSTTEWARMVFCLQDCAPLVVAGKRMGEDLGRGTDGVPPSGNDG